MDLILMAELNRGVRWGLLPHEVEETGDGRENVDARSGD